MCNHAQNCYVSQDAGKYSHELKSHRNTFTLQADLPNMSARPMSPDPARSPVHARRVYQVDVLIGRACLVRPYVLCRRLTAPHRTPNRPPRLAPLGGCSRTGPLSILQHTLHVVCSHAHGYPAHASIICIGLLSHICLPWRRRFPRGAGLLAQWRRAHARATL